MQGVSSLFLTTLKKERKKDKSEQKKRNRKTQKIFWKKTKETEKSKKFFRQKANEIAGLRVVEKIF